MKYIFAVVSDYKSLEVVSYCAMFVVVLKWLCDILRRNSGGRGRRRWRGWNYNCSSDGSILNHNLIGQYLYVE